MKAIAVSSQAKVLIDLLKKARRRSLILQLPDGHRFILSPVDGWECFEVGDDATQNKDLIQHLSKRRAQGKTIPLAKVKSELGMR